MPIKPASLPLLLALLGFGPQAHADEPAAVLVRPGLYVSGQPSQAQLQALPGTGVDTVIDLRQADEPRGYDEQAAAERLGLRYVRLPVAGAAGLTDANVSALRQMLAHSDGKVLLHCASGNRAGALLALLARRDGADLDTALELGRRAGMKPSLEPATRDALARH